jgi:glutaredoxin
MPTNEINIEIFTKNDCSLCDQAKEILESVLPDFPAKLKSINITSDPQLVSLFGQKVPVIRVDGEEWFKFKVSEEVLRKRLNDHLKKNK